MNKRIDTCRVIDQKKKVFNLNKIIICVNTSADLPYCH